MKTIRNLLAVLLVVGLCAAAQAAKDSAATVSLLEKAPKVDGKIEEGEWDGAVRTMRFHKLRPLTLDARGGASYCGFTKDRLYIAVVSELPPDQTLMTRKQFRDAAVVMDDSIEIWFDPNRDTRDKDTGGRDYYQFLGNSAGVIADTRFDPAKGAPDLGWNGNWEFANTVDKERGVWVAELSLPFKDLGWEGDPVGRSIGVLIARNFKRGWSQATWFPHKGAFVSWFQYPRIRLTADAPSVQIEQLGENLFKGALDLKVDVHNPGPARKATVQLVIESSDMPGLKDTKTLDLPAEGHATYGFKVPMSRLHEPAKHSMRLVVAPPDGTPEYLNYTMYWTKAPEKAWHVRTGPNPQAAVRLAYYPSFGFVRVRVDTGELEKGAEKIKSGQVTVLGPDGKQVVQKPIKWDKAPTEHEIEVGDLPDGQYTAVVKLDGYKDDFEREFRRIHFYWEGNRLGYSNEVFPPFTPIEVEENKVGVVLREHHVGGLGLWDSVRALDRELLAAPIALKTGDGKTLTGQGRFTKVAPHAVVYEGGATGPDVNIKTRCTTEFDGCMKVELTLEPGEGNKPLNKLWLDIPVKDSQVRLWHVTTTGLRRNPAGRPPKGTGQIWDSGEFPDGDWYGTFRPYIWVGAEERGICWFADNDRNWVLDVNEKKQQFAPCLTLHREDGTLSIRVHLVQKEVTLKEPRKIVFGLMASPAKPMPKNWRRMLFSRRHKGFETIGWMGSTYWGTAETMHETYPLNHDMSILSKMQEVRLTGDRSGWKYFIEQWSKRNLQGEVPGTKTKDQIRMLVRVSLSRASSQEEYLNVYWEEFHTVSRNHIETKIFGNEWSGGYWIGGMHPLAHSYLDFQCWYGAEFLRRGIGLYFDNTFPKRAYDPLTTNAYRLPNGSIQPSANMWRHREYLRRIWTLHRQLEPAGTKPMMMLHMTNTHIVPYMVWNDSNLDLEWFYGPDPQQSKYPHDLLRAESIGRQTGNIPLVLAQIKDTKSKEEKALAERTRFGTMMVHEIKWRYEGEGKKLIGHVLDFGYGADDCEVYNYWAEDYPVTAGNEEVKSLLLKRNSELLLVLATWNGKPEQVSLKLDTKRIGLQPKTATNAETGKGVILKGDTLTLQLEGYGVRVLKLK